jgi:hypothetical protein
MQTLKKRSEKERHKSLNIAKCHRSWQMKHFPKPNGMEIYNPILVASLQLLDLSTSVCISFLIWRRRWWNKGRKYNSVIGTPCNLQRVFTMLRRGVAAVATRAVKHTAAAYYAAARIKHKQESLVKKGDFLKALDTFPRRHIGPRADEVQTMLSALGLKSVDELMDKVVPHIIRS